MTSVDLAYPDQRSAKAEVVKEFSIQGLAYIEKGMAIISVVQKMIEYYETLFIVRSPS